MIAHVRQQEAYGCAIACCAMVRGVSYEEAAAAFGPSGRGFTRDVWQRHLALSGFAVQHIYWYDPFAGRPHVPWPLQPWADLHVCSVDAGHGMGSHLIVLRGDGAVLDPATDAVRRLSDYASVAYMAAVYPVGRRPVPPASSGPDAERGVREQAPPGHRLPPDSSCDSIHGPHRPPHRARAATLPR